MGSGEENKKEQQDIKVEQEDRTKKLALHMNEFWSLELPTEFTTLETNATPEPRTLCLRDCYKMVHARQSYGGFNPEIENIQEVEESEDKIGHEDMSADISDQQMVDYLKTKRQKQRHGIHFDSEENESSLEPEQKKRRFQKPDTSDVIKKEN